MSNGVYILGKANSLARRLYVELGFPDSEEEEFYKAEDGFKKQCWDMAVIAYIELMGIDPTDFIPKESAKLFSVSDIRKRILKSSTDGVKTGAK